MVGSEFVPFLLKFEYLFFLRFRYRYHHLKELQEENDRLLHTEQADSKCRNAVRRALTSNPEAFIAVIGCYAQLKPKEISSIEGVDVVLGAAEKFNLLDHITDEKRTSGSVSVGPIKEV